jgi:sterol desaturase/sphingolipid hydroxylase (fatty acid hydroxylase superfamily)
VATVTESLETLATVLSENVGGAVSGFALSPEFRMYWVWILLSIGLGTFSWFRYYGGEEPRSLRRLMRFLFPADVYRHSSAKVDYGVYLTNRILFGWVEMGAGIAATATALATSAQLSTWLGSSGDLFRWHSASMAAFTVASVVVSDAAVYLVHAAHHRIPVLWEFHRVHHTAEVLTPFTVYRKHPLYDLISASVRGVLMGVLQGVSAYAFIGRPQLVTLLGINVGYALFHAAGSNLRHTHIWLTSGPPQYGRAPLEPELWRDFCPMGLAIRYALRSSWPRRIFALWDWLFGTLYVPRGREDLHFGVKDAIGQEHPTLWAAYMVPFTNLSRLLGLKRSV